MKDLLDDPAPELRRREYDNWREREIKDLEVEKNHGPRPLEGFSGKTAGTTWTLEPDEAAAATEHAHDADDSLRASRAQIPPKR